MRSLIAIILMLASMAAEASVVYYSVAMDADTAHQVADNEARLVKALYESEGPSNLYLDKAWHGIDWLLSQIEPSKDDGLSKVIMGGKAVGVKLPFGQAYLHDPNTVKRLAALLANISTNDLRKRYDPAAMDKDEIYPSEWAVDPENLNALTHFFEKLKAFYAEAARNDHAILYAWG